MGPVGLNIIKTFLQVTEGIIEASHPFFKKKKKKSHVL